MLDKKILILIQDLSEDEKSFIEGWGYSLSFEFNEDEEYHFMIVDDYEFQMNDALRPLPKIFMGVPASTDWISKNNGLGWFHRDLIVNSSFVKMIKRILEKNSSLKLSSAYDGVVLKSKTYKIINTLSAGYYGDLVVESALAQKYNFIAIRSFVASIISYLEYLKDEDIVKMPLELDFGHSHDSFLVQFYLPCEGYRIDHIWKALEGRGINNPAYQLLNLALSNSDILNVYVLESSSKLVISGLWTKGLIREAKNYHSSFILHGMERFYYSSEDLNARVGRTLLGDKKRLNFKAEELEMPGDGYGPAPDSPVSKAANPILVKRLVSLVLSKAKGSYEGKGKISEMQIRNLIGSSSFKEKLTNLTRGDWDLMNLATNNPQERDILYREIEKNKKNISPSSYLESMIRNIEGSSLDEFREVAKGVSFFEKKSPIAGEGGRLNGHSLSEGVVNFNEEGHKVDFREGQGHGNIYDEVQRVDGQGFGNVNEEIHLVEGYGAANIQEEGLMVGGVISAEEDRLMVDGKSIGNINEEIHLQKGQGEGNFIEENVLHKGQGEGNINEEINLYKGNGEGNILDELMHIRDEQEVVRMDQLWQEKRSSIAKKLKDSFESSENDGLSKDVVDDKMKAIISEEMGIDVRPSDIITKVISEKGIEEEEEKRKSLSELVSEAKKVREVNRLKRGLAIREKQISKMKSLILGMRKEIVVLKQKVNDDVLTSAESGNSVQVEPAQKDRELEKVEGLQKQVQRQQGAFQMRLDQEKLRFKNDLLKKDKLIKQLERRLNVANLKAKSISGEDTPHSIDNTDVNQSTVLTGSSDSELLKKQSELAQLAMHKFKEENNLLKNEIEKLKNGAKLDSKMDSASFKPIIEPLDSDSKGSAQSGRASTITPEGSVVGNAINANKDSSEKDREITRLQKEAEAHLTQISKLNTNMKALELRFKQLSNEAKGGNNQKFAQQKEKMKSEVLRYKKELAEKKTEAHKLKLELKTNKLKIKELEKKVTVLSKRKVS